MPPWLARLVAVVVATSCALAVAGWVNCTWRWGPVLWRAYERSGYRLQLEPPRGCVAPAEAAQTTLSALLATLLALRPGPPEK